METFNRQTGQVRVMCPEEVDKGAEFECTLQGTNTGKTAKVEMEAMSDEDDYLNAADGPAFRNAVEQVTQP